MKQGKVIFKGPEFVVDLDNKDMVKRALDMMHESLMSAYKWHLRAPDDPVLNLSSKIEVKDIDKELDEYNYIMEISWDWEHDDEHFKQLGISKLEN